MSKNVEISEIKLDEEVIQAKEESVEPIEALVEDEFPEDIDEGDRRKLMDEYFPLPADFPGAEELKEMETKYGRIRIHRIAPNEAYVIRALNRAEFKTYVAILQNRFGDNVDSAEARLVQEELLVERCLLWPVLTPEQIRGEDTKVFNRIAVAGTVTVLSFDIQEISNLTDTAIGPIEEL
jgi:hypothetical protein